MDSNHKRVSPWSLATTTLIEPRVTAAGPALVSPVLVSPSQQAPIKRRKRNKGPSARKRYWITNDGEERCAWVVTFSDAVGKRTLKTFHTREDAEKFVRLIKSGKAFPKLGNFFTVQDALNRYLRLCEDRLRDGDRMTRITLRRYYDCADNHIIPLIGTVKLARLTPIMVDEFIKRLRTDKKNPRSAYTIKDAVSVLGRAITEAQRLQLVVRNVIKDARPRTPRVPAADIKVPSKEQMKHLLESCFDDDEFLIVALAASTGMRSSEICALMWNNIDFDGNAISVCGAIDTYCELKETKTKAGNRKVPLPPMLSDRLRAKKRNFITRPVLQYKPKYLSPRSPKSWWIDIVFNAKLGGPRTSHILYSQVWRPVCARAGFLQEDGRPLFHFHSLRHFAASMFIEQGLPPKRIQTLMGHTSITMTFDRYGHVFPDDGAAAKASAAIAHQLGLSDGEVLHGNRP